MKYIQQLDATDCGAACLAMIASHYGKSLDIAQVRAVAGTDVVGTSMNGMVIAAKNYDLEPHAVKGTAEAISQSTPVPFIANLHIIDDNVDLDHYVVVKKIHKNKIYIYNPDPTVKRKLISKDNFLKDWTGYALFLEPRVDFKKDSKKDRLLFKFLPVFLPHTKILIYTFIASLILMAFGIISSFYYKYVFDEVISAKANNTLTTLSLGIMILTISESIISMIRSIFLSHFSYKTDLQLNFSYLSHIFKLPISFFESRKSGEILSRLGDLGTIKSTISNTALSGIMDLLMILVSTPVLFSINHVLFYLSFASVLLLSLIAALFSRIYRSFYSKIMGQNADVQSYLYEALNGVATVKAMNAETIVYNEYEKKKMLSTATSWKVNHINIIQSLLTSLINGMTGIIILWLGSYYIINGKLSFGTLITFNSMLGYFTGPLYRLVNIQNDIQEALVAARRVGEVLELNAEMETSRKYYKPKNINGNISIKDITFRYGSRRPVYENLSLDIKEDTWTAFVGPSGCGKTTLTKLLLKFYDIEKGSILLDGNNLQDIDTQYLRSIISYVPQDIFLFSGTVTENIALHHDKTSMEEIVEACKKAGAHEFIEKLPNRYETILGEHGTGLSGGEKQRLALARALLGKPKLLILDEATSNLDTVSENEIHKVIRDLRKEHLTVILIAHRLSTVRNCDNIFVMKEGKIVEQGTHEHLLEKNGLYAQMWGETVV